MTNEQVSKFLCFVLRHHPEHVDVVLEKGGWADTDDLIRGCVSKKNVPLDRDRLAEIVRTDSKGRYSFDENGDRVRCNQGHSFDIDMEFMSVEPPTLLYHGTAERFLDPIFGEGIRKMSRQHVHLSDSMMTARTVGARHGRPVILLVEAKRMHDEGTKFFRSANGVWLVGHVPADRLQVA